MHQGAMAKNDLLENLKSTVYILEAVILHYNHLRESVILSSLQMKELPTSDTKVASVVA